VCDAIVCDKKNMQLKCRSDGHFRGIEKIKVKIRAKNIW
jgi:hypothetical protein